MDIVHRVKYLHEPLESAAKHAVEDLRQNGGTGGVIALDNLGNGAWDCSLPSLVPLPVLRSRHAVELERDVPRSYKRRWYSKDCNLC